VAAVWVIALGQKMFVASTLSARPVGCASGFGVGLRGDLARRCKRERCRPRASQHGAGSPLPESEERLDAGPKGSAGTVTADRSGAGTCTAATIGAGTHGAAQGKVESRRAPARKPAIGEVTGC
jgi:hypothetical protein